MTEPQNQIVARAAEDAADQHAHRRFMAFAVVLAVGVLVLAAAAAWLFGQGLQLRSDLGSVASQQRDAASAAQQLAQQVRRLGATPVVSPPAPVTSAPPAPGPTQAQIDAAVDRYLAAHPPAPGQSATPAMVATAVAAYLTANPPAPGRPPTADEIAAAAGTYISSHAAQFQGQPGQAGADGRPGADATDAQVSAAVAAYCDAHGGCAGPTGPTGPTGAAGSTGPQGVSITDLQFERDSSGTCQAVVTLHDPATGQDSVVTHPAGDAACPLLSIH